MGQNRDKVDPEIVYFFAYEAERNILSLSVPCRSTMNLAKEIAFDGAHEKI
jgi:hypothetical protein